MPRNSSTSNSSSFPLALLLALLLIVCCELLAARKLAETLSSHEVDWLMHYIEADRPAADYVLLGDSVGLQLSREYFPDPRFAMLASNQAVEVTGQYFILRRYLERHPPPRAVIFTALPFLAQDLSQIYTENFVLRVFGRPRELLDLLLAKRDLTMTAKAAAYSALFTYRHRLQLQKNIIGQANADVYSGVDLGKDRKTEDDYSLLNMLDQLKSLGRPKTSVAHFELLAELLHERKIPFYYLPAIVSETNHPAKRRHEALLPALAAMKARRPNFRFFAKQEEYPASLFVDGVHLNKKGMELARKHMKERILLVMRQTRPPSSSSTETPGPGQQHQRP